MPISRIRPRLKWHGRSSPLQDKRGPLAPVDQGMTRNELTANFSRLDEILVASLSLDGQPLDTVRTRPLPVSRSEFERGDASVEDNAFHGAFRPGRCDGQPSHGPRRFPTRWSQRALAGRGGAGFLHTEEATAGPTRQSRVSPVSPMSPPVADLGERGGRCGGRRASCVPLWYQHPDR
jgi:hypothetical protein